MPRIRRGHRGDTKRKRHVTPCVAFDSLITKPQHITFSHSGAVLSRESRVMPRYGSVRL